MSLTAFRPYTFKGDVSTSTTAAAVAIPTGSACVLLTPSVDTWVAFNQGQTVAAAAGTDVIYLPAKIPALFSLDQAWTSLSLVAGGAGKCNVAFGAQA